MNLTLNSPDACRCVCHAIFYEQIGSISEINSVYCFVFKWVVDFNRTNNNNRKHHMIAPILRIIRICTYTFWRLVYRSAYVIYCVAFKCKLRTLISYIAYRISLYNVLVYCIRFAIRMRTKQFVYLHEIMQAIVHL